MIRIALLLLCMANVASAQNPAGYTTMFNAAKARGCALAVFHQCEGREIAGVETMEASRFPESSVPEIIVGDPETLKCYRLKPTATDAEIRACFPAKSAARGNVREYVSQGIVYREYYTAPPATGATTYAPTPRQTPAYTPPQYATPYASSVYPSAGIYGGFQVGGYGAYGAVGADCYGGR